MTEINNPKEFCNGSQSGSQQLPQDPCNCVPNIIAGPNIALTPNEDGSVTISAVVTDTDTRLGNPHFIPGAPAGFNRLSYDLFNKLTNTTITADYTYVDIPDQDIQTLSIADNNLSISNGNTIPLPTDTVTNTIAGNTIATHTAVDGTVVNINETVTTLTDNSNGTFTYTSEDGTPTDIDMCAMFDDLPPVAGPYCLGTAPVVPVPSHGIARTDTVADTFVEVTHNDGFGNPTTAQVGLGLNITKDASNNLQVLPHNILGQHPTSVVQAINSTDTIKFQIDPTALLDDVKTEGTDTVIIPQLKRNSSATSGNILAKYNNNDLSLADYVVLDTQVITLTKPTIAQMDFNTDLFNPSLDTCFDVRFISIVDGVFYNYLSNAVNIRRTDPTSFGTTSVGMETTVHFHFSTALLSPGTHTIQIAFKVVEAIAAPTTPTFVDGDITPVSSLQRTFDITYI